MTQQETVEVTDEDREARKGYQQRFLTEGISESVLLDKTLAVHRIAAEKRQRERDAQALAIIAELTQNYGSVTFLPENDDATYKSEQIGIDCNGEWTGWKDRRFMAETHLDALIAAQAIRTQEQDQ